MNYICTSLNCTGEAGTKPHCPECSHLLVYDTVEVRGKKYKFEFAPRFGFQLEKKGEYDWSPSHRNPVWKELQAWQDKCASCIKRRIQSTKRH